MDSMLAPSEWRRYSNQIYGWFAFFFTVIFAFWISVLFYNDIFLPVVVALVKKNTESLQDINLFAFFFKSSLALALSYFPANFLTQKITKAVQRIEILEGNFIDDTPEVFKNLAKDFSNKSCDYKVKLISKDEIDYNQTIDHSKNYPKLKKPVLIKQDIFLPKDILELSFIVRGEAGSGKTVFTDRLVKETIEAGHKVILHNVKGDEFEKLNGYCPFYLIEPWNDKAGYAIDFLSLVARKKEIDRNTYITALVESFTKKDKANAFFSDGAVEVLFAVIKKVVEDEMLKPQYKANLRSVVNLWNSFNANTDESEIDLTDITQMKKKADEKNESLMKIKKLLIEKNPTQANLIDPENAKTSLCVLATCTKVAKKFEVLSDFWGDREHTKSFDIEKWLADKKDRPVLLLSNSNIYTEVAESYISAVINLLTMFVINTEYKPTSELHFILDEFPQLSSINLKQFMKLPDVGRGKKVRVKVVMQRTSQIKEQFDVDANSFAGAFQNKIWARFASDDFTVINAELGKNTVKKIKTTSNTNKDGRSNNESSEEKDEDVINPSNIQKELGPVAINDKFLGVKILFNFSMTKRIAIAIIPPVSFPKKKKRRATATSNTPQLGGTSTPTGTANDEEALAHAVQPTHAIETVLEVLPPVELDQAHHQADDPLNSAVMDIAGHVATPEPIGMALQALELMEALETSNNNNNTLLEASTETEEDQNKAKMLAILNKNKKKKEIDL